MTSSAKIWRQQMRAVVKKNLQLKYRRPILTGFECICPGLMAILSIIFLYFVDSTDFLEHVPWHSHENETILAIDSMGSTFMWDPFPTSCLITMVQEEIQGRRPNDQEVRKGDFENDEAVMDERMNTPFKNWIRHDPSVPAFINVVAMTLLADPRRDPVSKTFVVGPGSDGDFTTMGGLLKNYMENRAKPKYDFYTTLVTTVNSCFLNGLVGNSWDACKVDPRTCITRCVAVDGVAGITCPNRRVLQEMKAKTRGMRFHTKDNDEWEFDSSRNNVTRRLEEDECEAIKNACECARFAHQGCGWEVQWHDDDEDWPQEEEERGPEQLCVRRTRRYVPVTSCFECASQAGCSDEDLWARLRTTVANIKPTVKVFANADAFEDEMSQSGYPKNDKSQYCAGVMFTEPSVARVSELGVAEYSIRLNNTLNPFRTRRQTSVFPIKWIIYNYIGSGFVHLQQTIDDFITCGKHAAKYGCLNAENFRVGLDTDTRLLSFPTPAHVENLVIAQIVRQVGGNMFFGMACTATVLAYHLLKERELRIREGMKAMGALDSVQYTETFVFNSVWTAIISLSCALIFAETTGEAGFNATTTGTLFILIWATFMNTMAFTALMTSFFSNVFPGLLFVFLMVSGLDILRFAMSADNDPVINNLLALFPATNFRLCMNCILLFEQVGSSNNFGMLVEDFSLGMGVLMNVIATILWTFFYYYTDQVKLKEVGVQRPLHFPFQANYWREVLGMRRRKIEQVVPGTTEHFQVKQRGLCVEQPTEAMKAIEAANQCVEVKGLLKIYRTPEGSLTAVNNVDMTMYKGEIFALLGHNGAGKTTVLNILTGLVDATDGNIKLYGNSLEENLIFGRADVGICPQQSVLWPLLTVQEHLEIFAAFKGTKYSAIEKDMNELLRQLHLYDWRHWQTRRLSGGMQRKLALAIAFVGNPSLVFLDEPSSGMDTTARRHTWDILRNGKAGRIIVLTTHYMEEADVLGDRICIMDHGEVRCCGSAQYLKDLYGCGYNISCLLDASDDKVKNNILKIASESLKPYPVQVLSKAGKEISFLAPFESTPQFSALFTQLDDRAKSHVETFSVGVANLEEVFLKVASGFTVHQKGEDDVIQNQHICLEAGEMTDIGGKSEVTGCISQMQAQFYKQWTYSKRTPVVFFCKLCCPAVYTIMCLILLLSQARDERSMLLTTDDLNELQGHVLPVARTSFSDNKAFIDENAQAAADNFGGTPLPGWIIDYTETCQDTAKISECEPSTPNSNFRVLDCLSAGNFTDVCTNAIGNVVAKDDCNGQVCMIQSGALGRCSTDHGGNVADMKCTYNTSVESYMLCAKVYTTFKKQDEMLRSMAYRLEGTRNSEALSRFGAIVHPPMTPSTAKYYTGTDNVQFILLNLTSLHAPGIYVNLHSNILLQQANKPGRIKTFNHPFPYTAVEEQERRLGVFFFSAVTVMIGFGIVTGFSVAYVVHEREKELKMQQFVSGVGIFPYWASFYITDWIVNVIACCGIFLVLLIFDIVHLIDTRYDQLQFVLVVMITFCFAQVPFVYLFSNMFSQSNTAMILTIVLNLIFAPIFLFLLFITEAFLLSELATPLYWLIHLVEWIHWIWRLIPVFSIGDALIQTVYLSMLFENDPPELKTDDKFTKCIKEAKRGESYLPSCSRDIWDSNGPMVNVYIMIGVAIIYPIITMTFEYMKEVKKNRYANVVCFSLIAAALAIIGVAAKSAIGIIVGCSLVLFAVICGISIHRLRSAEDVEYTGPCALRDEDVTSEEERVRVLSASEDKKKAIIVSNIRKTYVDTDRERGCRCCLLCEKGSNRKTVFAVQGVSFSAEPGEVFGLLGVNGAGKSTTFKMLLGTLAATKVNRLVLAGMTDVIAARHHIGYCPQDNTLFMYMTCREHLLFYGRIKGIRAAELGKVATDLLTALNLTEYANKVAGTLSGGNKRKLCVALSLMGSPPLIFLDEPSTGVDPMARRFMWSVIQKLASGNRHCTVILTTHSMEECEALCSRAVIMVNGVFRCMGATQHLKQLYGQGFACWIRNAESFEDKFDQVVELWETTPTGKAITELSEKKFIRYETLKKIATELGEIWHVLEMSGQNSPYEVSAKVATAALPMYGYQMTQVNNDTIPLSAAVTWWCITANTRRTMVDLVQVVRAALSAPPLTPGSISAIGTATDGSTVKADTIGSRMTDEGATEANNAENAEGTTNEESTPSTALSLADEEVRRYAHLDLAKDDVAKTFIQEVHGNKVVVRVQTHKAMSLLPVFEKMEELKKDNVCVDYTVCHTSLERIFNTFSKEAATNVQIGR